MKIFISLLFAGVLAAADPATKPIPKVYIAAVNGLGSRVQQVTKEAQDAIAEYEVDLCKQAKIKRDVCLVDWRAGTVGVKPKDVPKPAVETPPGK